MRRRGKNSRVLKEMYKVRFCSLLQREDSRALPTETRITVVDHVRHHIQGNLAYLQMWSEEVNI